MCHWMCASRVTFQSYLTIARTSAKTSTKKVQYNVQNKPCGRESYAVIHSRFFHKLAPDHQADRSGRHRATALCWDDEAALHTTHIHRTHHENSSVQTSTRCFRRCIGCLLSSASTASWPWRRSRLSRRHLHSIWASTSCCAPAHVTLDRRPSHCCACHFDGHHLPDDHSALEAEFASVQSWARDNKLQINLAKTKEIVITRCGRRGFMQPPLMPGVARKNLVKLLGVTFNNHLPITFENANCCSSKTIFVAAAEAAGTWQYLLRCFVRSHCIVHYAICNASLFRLPHWIRC